jgi:hypothetical protein
MRGFKKILLAAILLTCGSGFAAQISIGISIGPPPPPRVIHVLPPQPGPEFIWIEGYWYPEGRHYKWYDGYWARPPYAGARWVLPRHDGVHYFAGYWEGERGRIEHDRHDKHRRGWQEDKHGKGRGRNR